MTTVNSYLDQAARECRHELLLEFDGFVIRFTTNSPSLHRELEGYYRHFRANEGSRVHCTVAGLQTVTPDIKGDWQVKTPEPGKTKIKEHILAEDGIRVVRKILTGVHLFFAGDRHVCAGPLEDNPNQVVNFINNVYLDQLLAPSGQLFHAAGVCQGKQGLGMAGYSGKGKSTLALRLLDRGLDLVSNDRLVVDEVTGGLSMRGIAKYPRINPGTILNEPRLVDMASEADLARYRALSQDELWQLEEKYDAFVEDRFGCEFILGSQMTMFVALDWDRRINAPARLERRDPADCRELVKTVMKAPGVMLPRANARIGQPDVSEYVALLSQCEFLVLTGGVDFDAAADQILEALAARP